MRRPLHLCSAVVLLAFSGLAGSFAPAVAAAAAPTGNKVCTIHDPRLIELSGLIATARGYIVINDSSDVADRKPVFFLTRNCAVNKTVSFPSEPRDPEDLALSPDQKTLWISDTGDLDAQRETVALWKMPADGSKQPEIYRLKYPDGAKDAEALLIGKDGLPIIVTKTGGFVYRATAPLRKNVPTVLEKAGEVTLTRTNTSNPLGVLGRAVVTGAAASPDGSKVVLRSYADAFEWDVPDGDIVKALTSNKPRVTAMPDEPWGESISYSVDGSKFLTVSETAQNPDLNPAIQSYTPAKERATAEPLAAVDASTKPDSGGIKAYFAKLSLGDITVLVASVGGIGLLLVLAGVFGIVRARRRTEAADPDDKPARKKRGGGKGHGDQASGTDTPRPQYPAVAESDWDGGEADLVPGLRDADGARRPATTPRPQGAVYGGVATDRNDA